MPANVEILTVQMQYGALTLWAVVDLESDYVNRAIHIAGTGHPRQHREIDPKNYIATVQDHNLVWHIFDGGEYDV